jgi:hypothetical protein
MHSTSWTAYRDSFAVVMTRYPLLLSHNNVLSCATEPIGLEPSTTGSISQDHLQSDAGSSSHPLVIHPSRVLHWESIQKRRNDKHAPSLHNEKPSIADLVQSIHIRGAARRKQNHSYRFLARLRPTFQNQDLQVTQQTKNQTTKRRDRISNGSFEPPQTCQRSPCSLQTQHKSQQNNKPWILPAQSLSLSS